MPATGRAVKIDVGRELGTDLLAEPPPANACQGKNVNTHSSLELEGVVEHKEVGVGAE